MLTSTSIHVVGQAPPSAYYQCLYPQGEVQLPSTTPGDSPRLTGGLDPWSFQIVQSRAEEIIYKILCVSFKRGVYFSQGLLKASPDGLQSQLFQYCLTSAGPLCCGAQCGAQTPQSLG